jgi:hypothetical protein
MPNWKRHNGRSRRGRLDALSGKQIDTRAAEVLIRDAGYIAEQGFNRTS